MQGIFDFLEIAIQSDFAGEWAILGRQIWKAQSDGRMNW